MIRKILEFFMKKIIITALILASTSTFAGLRFVCQEYSRLTGQALQRTVVLEQLNDQPMKEAVNYPFSIAMYDGFDHVNSPILETIGSAQNEDVNFDFNSFDKKISFHIYLDELSESTLYINGNSAGTFSCR